MKPDAPSGDTEVTAEIGENSTFDTDLVRVPFAVENGTVRIGNTNGTLNDQILLPAGILCAVFLIAAVAEIVRKKKTRKAGD